MANISLRQASNVVSTSNFFPSFIGGRTKNGTVVNNQTALTLSAVYNAIDIISNDIAKISKSVYRKDGANRNPQPLHPLNNLIAFEPNGMQIAFDWWKVSEVCAMLKGNFYAFIERNPYTASPQALYMWNPDDVTVYEKDNKIYYKYKGKMYDNEDVFHIKGFSLNGLTGLSFIQFAAQSLGVSLSSQEYAVEYYNGKGVGSGVVTTPKDLNTTGKRKISEAVTDVLTEISPWKIPVLDEGMQFIPLKITAEESNFLATNKFGIEEIARWTNIPVHKLKNLDRATNNNIEHQSLEYVSDSMMPRVVRNEQEIRRKLFTEKEKQNGFYVKFNMNSLLRVDVKSRADYYTKMRYAGIMSGDEIREKEDMNPTGLEHMTTPLQPVQIQQQSQIDTTDGN